MIKVIGLRKEFFIIVRDEDEKVPHIFPEYTVLLENYGVLYELHLWMSIGMCYSGYTTASWGNYSLRRTDECGPLTHAPKKKIEIEIDICGLWEHSVDDFDCGVFGWSTEGGDYYYPEGWASVDETLFKETGRGYPKPVVWIFHGSSNLGKSTLARLANGLEVYETDRSKKLKDNLVYAQIIVIGRKYPHTVDDIKAVFNKHGLDVELIPVMFGQL